MLETPHTRGADQTSLLGAQTTSAGSFGCGGIVALLQAILG